MAEDRGPGVVRESFFSTQVDEVERHIGSVYADIEYRVPSRSRIELGHEPVWVGGFGIGHMWTNASTTARIGPMGDTLLVAHVRDGTLRRIGSAFGETVSRAGDTVVVPPVGEFTDIADGLDLDLVALDPEQLVAYVEHLYGAGVGSLRVTGLTPTSTVGHDRWRDTALYVRDKVVGNPVLADNPIVTDRAFRYLARAYLAAFPTTVVGAVAERRVRTAGRRIAHAKLGEIREYLTAHAAEPVSPGEIAALAGAPAVAVAETLYRRHGVHPAEVLWGARLDGVRRALRDATPSTTDVVTVAARWGFVRPGAFRASYARTFGEFPEQTLRS